MPDGVRQEVCGYLCTHYDYAIRALMNDTAGPSDADPRRISFTRSLRAARRSVRAGIGISRSALVRSLAVARAEIGRELVPQRLRAAARVVKRKMSAYHVKRAQHRQWPQPTISLRHACFPRQLSSASSMVATMSATRDSTLSQYQPLCPLGNPVSPGKFGPLVRRPCHRGPDHRGPCQWIRG